MFKPPPMPRFVPCFAAFVALLPLVATPAFAQTNITVDAGAPVRTVNDRMFGLNAVLWDGRTSDPQTISLISAAGLRFIRIPGGSLSDEYHWTTNTSLANTWHWASSTSDFAALITALNAQATCVANYGSGSPEEAAAWVAYFNAPATLLGTSSDVALGTDAKGVNWKTAGYWSSLRAAAKLGTDDGLNFLRLGRAAPVGVKCWEIGNEVYGATWETDQNTPAHDPYTYAVRTKDYIAKMKAVDPTVKVGVVAVTGEDQYANNTNHPATNPRTGLVHNGWTPVLLATLKSLGVTPDALVYHRYEQSPGKESDAALLQAPKTWPKDAADLRQQLSDYLGAAGANVELVVTENNSVFTDPGKQSTSLVNGLFYAAAVGNILQTEFNEYTWWALRNGTPTSGTGALVGNVSASLYGWRQYGDYGALSSPNSFGQANAFEGYPSYYAMKLVSKFARGGDTVVSASSTNALLLAYAAKRTNGTLTLLVINASPTDDTTAAIAVAGFTPKSAATVYSYGVPQDDAARTGVGSPDIATTSIANAGPTFSVTFAHYSATVVTLAASAPAIAVQPTGGSVATGANVTLAVLANGQGPLAFQWYKAGAALSGATSTALSLPSVTASDAGDYKVVVTDAAGATVTSTAATLTVTPDAYAAPAAGLFNLSTRAQVGTDANVMIAGFVLGGSGAKKVLIRAVGPGLSPWFSTGYLADPQLVVTKSDGTFIAANDDWGTGDATAIKAAGDSVGAFALADGSKDAAIVVTLPAGGPTGFSGYTVTVKGAYGGTGIALVEVYDLDFGSPARLVNLSTRAQVGTGANAMIGGFAVRGSGQRNILIRAVGPTLGQFIGGVLADPMLNLTKPDGTPIATNDNWGDTNGSAIAAASATTGGFAFPSGSKDAAILLPLDAGGSPKTYTPIVTGNAGTTGIALVEAYDVP